MKFENILVEPDAASDGGVVVITLNRPESLNAMSRALVQAKFDLSSAEKLLGYVPQESWPTGCSDF